MLRGSIPLDVEAVIADRDLGLRALLVEGRRPHVLAETGFLRSQLDRGDQLPHLLGLRHLDEPVSPEVIVEGDGSHACEFRRGQAFLDPFGSGGSSGSFRAGPHRLPVGFDDHRACGNLRVFGLVRDALLGGGTQ